MTLFGLQVQVQPEIKWPHFGKKLRHGAARLASRLVTRLTANVKSFYEVRPIEDGWMIAKKGSTLPVRVFAKKQDALREARRMAREYRAQLDVFGKDGSHQNHYSFMT